jgi:hypothetical protein
VLCYEHPFFFGAALTLSRPLHKAEHINVIAYSYIDFAVFDSVNLSFFDFCKCASNVPKISNN